MSTQGTGNSRPRSKSSNKSAKRRDLKVAPDSKSETTGPFWRMQTVFKKLRTSSEPLREASESSSSPKARKKPAPPPSPGPPSYKRKRPSWLGPAPGNEHLPVTPCDWAVPPAERLPAQSEGTQPWHEILGLSPQASEDQLRRRFREIVKSYHPDHGGDDQTFHIFARAYRQALRAKVEGDPFHQEAAPETPRLLG